MFHLKKKNSCSNSETYCTIMEQPLNNSDQFYRQMTSVIFWNYCKVNVIFLFNSITFYLYILFDMSPCVKKLALFRVYTIMYYCFCLILNYIWPVHTCIAVKSKRGSLLLKEQLLLIF